MSRYIGLFLMAVPLFAGAVLAGMLVARRRVARLVAHVPDGWVLTTGILTDESAGPVITYRVAGGAEYTFAADIGVFQPGRGATVGVYHDPDDPSQARIAPGSIPPAARPLSRRAVTVIAAVLVPLAVALEIIGFVLLTD